MPHLARQDMGTTQHFPRAAPGSFWGDRRSLLLGANACDPNAMDDRGDTALHLAAGNGDKGACQAGRGRVGVEPRAPELREPVARGRRTDVLSFRAEEGTLLPSI